MKWVKYIRTEATPGWKELYVWIHEDTLEPMIEGGKTSGEAQCATMHRIPFRMKHRRLIEAYRPDIAQAVS